jgi:hypothetical protein
MYNFLEDFLHELRINDFNIQQTAGPDFQGVLDISFDEISEVVMGCYMRNNVTNYTPKRIEIAKTYRTKEGVQNVGFSFLDQGESGLVFTIKLLSVPVYQGTGIVNVVSQQVADLLK